ncbi:transporter [Pedobacter aquatilis]|uniref:transporter n=1 Tax=Pedobacter aquatilis TaxID=351343 RepID=UPI00292FF704|nr:transporter [Pedobacter aquatilis]
MKKLYFILLFTAPIFALAQNIKQKHYSLFRPVPRALMRELETDRPDVTESPITVDAGHVQFESDLFREDRAFGDYSTKNSYLINQMNLKIGLSGHLAMQLSIGTFAFAKTTDLGSGTIAYRHGFGDLVLRIKQNIVGNDQGNFAVAILPYLILPTSGLEDEHRYQAGLILPMSLKLPGDWKLGMQLEGDRLKDTEGRELHTSLLQTLSASHELIKHLDGIAESYYTYDLKAHQLMAFLNASLQFEINKNCKVDAGINYGIDHAADKRGFVGLSFRL